MKIFRIFQYKSRKGSYFKPTIRNDSLHKKNLIMIMLLE